MGLQKCGLNLNRAGKELQPHGTRDFPCAGYAAEYTEAPEDTIGWHWHEEMEIAYVADGCMKFNIPAESFWLGKGDLIIINANVAHFAAADYKTELRSLVFNPLLLTGTSESIFAQKYFSPLVSYPSFSGYLIKASAGVETADAFNDAFEALAQDAPGFEFVVRNKLSDICLFLRRQFEDKISVASQSVSQDEIRIKKMLDCVHGNYPSDLTLSAIAKAADIGTRECLRCFQRTVRISPMQYLLKYRITQGASLLSVNQSENISEISALCGFESASNFSKMFRRFYGCTPREYRKRK